jgi:hypothetical protein
LEENKKIFLFLLAFFHIYMKKDLKAKPDLPYICIANRALIYICAFSLPPPPIINVDLRKEEGGLN